VSPGALYSSGLIAAGGIVGLAGMVIKVMEAKRWLPENSIAWGPRLIPGLANSNILSVIMFGLLGYSLYYFARKPLQTEK
ncbi:MAG TPA: hypothetical protein VFY05_01225, partial [Candidatus Angelobacter sp.]|nr:hypothetical protein [Candidatus Angelobacter sp.]